MIFKVVEKEQLFDLCEELARNGEEKGLASLCEEAERQLNDDDGLEVVGDLLFSASFDD